MLIDFVQYFEQIEVMAYTAKVISYNWVKVIFKKINIFKNLLHILVYLPIGVLDTDTYVYSYDYQVGFYPKLRN